MHQAPRRSLLRRVWRSIRSGFFIQNSSAKVKVFWLIVLVAAVGAFSAPLVLISPEVGLTVVPATAAGRRFTDELGVLNQRLADCCERVVLIIAGQPVWLKPAPAEASR